MMWKLRLGLFLFCLAVLATANIVYVVIESTSHAHEDLPLPTTVNPTSRLRSAPSLNLLQNKEQPCSDFYNYTCATYGYIEDVLTYVRRDNRRRVDDIVKHANTTNIVSQLYESCEVYKRTKLFSPTSSSALSVLLTSSTNVRNYDDLAFLWGRLQLYNAIAPLEFAMIKNPWKVDTLLPSFEQSGLFDDPSRLTSEEHRLEVENRLTFVYRIDDARDWSHVIVDIETTLYSIFNEDGNTRGESFLQYLKTHGQRDLLPRREWQSSIADRRFNVTNYLLGCKPTSLLSNEEWLERLNDLPLWCRAQEYLSVLPSVIVKYPLQAWVAYTKYAIMLLDDVPASNYGTSESVLTSVMPSTDFDRYLSIDKGHLDCGAFVEEWLNSDVVHLYSSMYIDQRVIEEVRDLAENLREKFVRLLHAHKDLQEKVTRLTLSVGDTGGGGSALPSDEPTEFIDRFLQLKKERIASRFLGTEENLVLPLHVGARYRHQANTLDISVGLLREPLYQEGQGRAALYAQLATIVGHELVHSIDGIGMNFDGNGNYLEMSNASVAWMRDILSCSLTGRERTQNEDFADLLGVSLAYWTLMSLPSANDADREEFFRTYALRFCHRPLTDLEQTTFVRKSTHSLAEYRVNNVLQSNPDFLAMYTCSKVVNDCIKL